jgi:hypothetical protein
MVMSKVAQQFESQRCIATAIRCNVQLLSILSQDGAVAFVGCYLAIESPHLFKAVYGNEYIFDPVIARVRQ